MILRHFFLLLLHLTFQNINIQNKIKALSKWLQVFQNGENKQYIIKVGSLAFPII